MIAHDPQLFMAMAVNAVLWLLFVLMWWWIISVIRKYRRLRNNDDGERAYPGGPLLRSEEEDAMDGYNT